MKCPDCYIELEETKTFKEHCPKCGGDYLFCHNCGELTDDQDYYSICECGYINCNFCGGTVKPPMFWQQWFGKAPVCERCGELNAS